MIRTDFGGRFLDFAMGEDLTAYAPTAAAMGRLFVTLESNPSGSELVADVIWQAVTVPDEQLRFRAGPADTSVPALIAISSSSSAIV